MIGANHGLSTKEVTPVKGDGCGLRYPPNHHIDDPITHHGF